MGQSITVDSMQIGDVVVFGTDRSITGQDGAGFGSRTEAESHDEFPARLALRIFDAHAAVDHVFVASNQVVVRADGDWTSATISEVATVISDFFLYYPDAG